LQIFGKQALTIEKIEPFNMGDRRFKVHEILA
jgi:hypothetical protein